MHVIREKIDIALTYEEVNIFKQCLATIQDLQVQFGTDLTNAERAYLSVFPYKAERLEESLVEFLEYMEVEIE